MLNPIRRIEQWVDSCRRRKLDHKKAWAPALEHDNDGIAHFQRDAVEALRQALAERELSLDLNLVRTDSEELGHYFEGEIPAASTKVWIYDDTLSVVGPEVESRIEHWDCDNPDAAIEAFLGLVLDNLE